MGKNYNIDINYLKEIQEMLLQANDFQSYSDTFLVERLIKQLSQHGSFPTESYSLDMQILDDLKDLPFYKPFYPYSKAILTQSIFFGAYSPTYQSIPLSDDDAISLVRHFFGSQNKRYQEYMNDFLEEAPDHISFIPPNSHTDGETTFLKSTGDFFSVIPDYSNLTKATILTHEVTHIFDWFQNDHFIMQFLIHEFHALFMEMLSCDYYNDCLGLGEENKKRRLGLHSLIQSDSQDIYYRMQILNLYKKYGKEKGMEIIHKLFSEKYLQYTAQYSLLESFLYQIAYLIAIELYMLYQKDKEKALWIAERIVQTGTNQNIQSLLRTYQIQLLSHFHIYEQSMILKKTI